MAQGNTELTDLVPRPGDAGQPEGHPLGQLALHSPVAKHCQEQGDEEDGQLRLEGSKVGSAEEERKQKETWGEGWTEKCIGRYKRQTLCNRVF